MSHCHGNSRQQIIAQLAQQLGQIERREIQPDALLSTGCPALDRLLPAGAMRRGTLIEWLSSGVGSGAGTLALLAARQAVEDGRPLVVIDRQAEFYAAGAAALGLPLEQLIVVRPRHPRDDLWAIEQVLRCPGVAAAWCQLPSLSDRGFRRLQLAAERGGAVAMLLRPLAVRGTPTWAEARLLVEPLSAPQGRRVRVELLHARGGLNHHQALELEVNDEAGVVRLVPRLAPSASLRRAARA